MVQLIGVLCGELFCLYMVVFRWPRVERKYGRIDLLFWVQAVVLSFWFLAYLAEVGMWVVWADVLE